MRIAEKESTQKTQHMRDLVFALLDYATVLLLLIPFYGQPDGDYVRMVSWLHLTEVNLFMKVSYCIIVVFTVLFGIAVLALQNWSHPVWVKTKSTVSLVCSILAVLLFMVSLEPYAACFVFILLIIKGVLLLQRP